MRTAKDAGHEVSIALVGDAVYLMKSEALDSVVGVGVGTLKEHYEAIREARIPVFASQLSSKSRGVTKEDLDKKAKFILPPRLVALAIESDTVLTY